MNFDFVFFRTFKKSEHNIRFKLYSASICYVTYLQDTDSHFLQSVDHVLWEDDNVFNSYLHTNIISV